MARNQATVEKPPHGDAGAQLLFGPQHPRLTLETLLRNGDGTLSYTVRSVFRSDRLLTDAERFLKTVSFPDIQFRPIIFCMGKGENRRYVQMSIIGFPETEMSKVVETLWKFNEQIPGTIRPRPPESLESYAMAAKTRLDEFFRLFGIDPNSTQKIQEPSEGERIAYRIQKTSVIVHLSTGDKNLGNFVKSVLEKLSTLAPEALSEAGFGLTLLSDLPISNNERAWIIKHAIKYLESAIEPQSSAYSSMAADDIVELAYAAKRLAAVRLPLTKLPETFAFLQPMDTASQATTS